MNFVVLGELLWGAGAGFGFGTAMVMNNSRSDLETMLLVAGGQLAGALLRPGVVRGNPG
ncbi:MAG: hypothetical protein HY901_33635 [Deltaproteobacteria bacterium]|nr:hypothetical protein [Deltaproteobacteria bacterium]